MNLWPETPSLILAFFLLSLFSYFPFCPKPLLHSSVSLPPPFVHLLVMQSPPLPLSSPPSRSPCSSVLFFSTYFLHSSSSSFTFPCLLLTLSFLSCSPSPLPPLSSFPPVDEISLLEGLTIVYKSSIDLFFYVVGSVQENEVSSATSSGFLSLQELNDWRLYRE